MRMSFLCALLTPFFLIRTVAGAVGRSDNAFPSIEGIWQEAPGILVTVECQGATFKAKCAYQTGFRFRRSSPNARSTERCR